MQVLNARPISDRIEDSPINNIMDLVNFKSQGNYCIHTRYLGKLRSSTRFTQLRFHCSSTNGSLHIKTTPNTTSGITAVKFLSSYAIRDAVPFCEAFVDDKSRVLQDCGKMNVWDTIQGASPNEYYMSIWNAGRFDRFVCAETVDKTKLGDFWEVFAR